MKTIQDALIEKGLASEPKKSLPKKTKTQNSDKLTPEQIANWRRVLALQIGIYAFIAPENEIQQLRDKCQTDINNL